MLLSALALALGVGTTGCSGSSHFAATDGGPGGATTGGAAGNSSSGGGVATGGAGVGGAGNGGPPGCTSAVDCADRTDGKTACDVASGQCVSCVTNADCAADEDCVGGACQAAVVCTNSLDCAAGLLCDSTSQRCVECLTAVDCSSGQTCANHLCRPTCQSDKDCTPLGLLCNVSEGHCVNCVAPTDCAESQFCSDGVCAPDVCAANTSDCSNNAVVTCNTVGSGTLPPVACSSSQTCVASGSTATCQDQICVPSVRGCESGAERVVLCSDDGLSQQVTEDCGAKSQVCVAAACVPIVCTAGQKFCQDNEVRQCSVKGESSVVVQTCLSSQFCDSAGGSAACSNQLCTPNQPACNGDIATTCNADGSGYVTGGVDCTSSSLHCVGGECKNQICSPNALFCDAGAVYLCDANGLASTLSQTCTSGQYCDEATATCKAQVCVPNQPACNANTATTCNADGSGFLSGGTACGAQYCVSGSCQNALFAEDWEDGDYAGWTVGTDSYTRSITTAFAANGTAHSLMQTSPGTTVHQQGLYHTFANLTPSHISWWVMPTSTSQVTGYFVLSSGSSSSYVVWIYFHSTGMIRNYLTSSPVETAYTANQWYHLEMRNIDWTAHTYDWYINGTLIQASMPFYSALPDITRLDIYNYGAGTAYWDEIVFQ